MKRCFLQVLLLTILWDEFQPALLRLDLRLESTAGGVSHRDDRTVNFGMRRFATRRNQFTINGRPVFLRGKLDCCFFPLTGYPPMDKAGWRRVLSIANHKLGLLFETRVGRGKLLICAIDLLGHQDKPETRQLLHSLLRYVDSAAFAPKAELDAEVLRKLFPDAK